MANEKPSVNMEELKLQGFKVQELPAFVDVPSMRDWHSIEILVDLKKFLTLNSECLKTVLNEQAETYLCSSNEKTGIDGDRFITESRLQKSLFIENDDQLLALKFVSACQIPIPE